MVFDPRLVGLWRLPERQDEVLYEWTTSGRLFIHDIPTTYHIDPDGLTLHWVDEPPFERLDEPAGSLPGSWRRHHVEDDATETLTFNPDGSYLSTWDPGDNYWGLYEDLGNRLRTIEYRGQVITDAGRYRHVVGNDAYDYRYEVADADHFILHDDVNGLQYHYERSSP
jgi:hypothetical protein